jgi:hypothetical protein
VVLVTFEVPEELIRFILFTPKSLSAMGFLVIYDISNDIPSISTFSIEDVSSLAYGL